MITAGLATAPKATRSVTAPRAANGMTRSVIVRCCCRRCSSRTRGISTRAPAARHREWVTPSRARSSRRATTDAGSRTTREFSGALASGALSNLYYPAEDRKGVGSDIREHRHRYRRRRGGPPRSGIPVREADIPRPRNQWCAHRHHTAVGRHRVTPSPRHIIVSRRAACRVLCRSASAPLLWRDCSPRASPPLRRRCAPAGSPAEPPMVAGSVTRPPSCE